MCHYAMYSNISEDAGDRTCFIDIALPAKLPCVIHFAVTPCLHVDRVRNDGILFLPLQAT